MDCTSKQRPYRTPTRTFDLIWFVVACGSVPCQCHVSPHVPLHSGPAKVEHTQTRSCNSLDNDPFSIYSL